MLSQQEKYAERAREQRVAREWTDKVEKSELLHLILMKRLPMSLKLLLHNQL